MLAIRFGYRCLKKFLVLDVTRLLVVNIKDIRNQAVKLPNGYHMRRLNPEELEVFANDDRYGLDQNMVSRLRTGFDECVATFHGEQLASYLWLARHSIESEQNRGDHLLTGVSISFPEHSLFVYNAFTVESHRGKGLLSRLLEFAASELGHHDLQQLVSTTDWTNRAALRAFKKSGFESVGIVWRSVTCGLSITKGPKTARRYGIAIGDQAEVISRP